MGYFGELKGNRFSYIPNADLFLLMAVCVQDLFNKIMSQLGNEAVSLGLDEKVGFVISLSHQQLQDVLLGKELGGLCVGVIFGHLKLYTLFRCALPSGKYYRFYTPIFKLFRQSFYCLWEIKHSINFLFHIHNV